MKSSGGIVFCLEGSKIKFLLLRHKKTGSHWGFPKGRQKKGESEKETASREIIEETGINNFEMINSFREVERYSFINRDNIKVDKEVSYFLVKVNSSDVGLSEEHSEFCWKEFHEALKKLDKEEAKIILKKAHERLKWDLQ